MNNWFYLFLVLALIGFIMLIGTTVWAYQWSRGNASTTNENAPAGIWILFGLGLAFFFVGFIGMMFFLPYGDWYNY